MDQFKPIEPTNKAEPSIVEWLESGFKLGLEARRPFERVALQSMLFWGGSQWTNVMSDNAQVFSSRDIRPDNCDTVRRVNNQIPIYTRQIISSMSDNMPDFEAIPATYEPQDIEAAALATKILKFRDRQDNEDELRELELMWALGTGEVLRRTIWDADAKHKGLPTGDINTETVNFFKYVKDPGSVDIWPPKWLVEFDSLDVDLVRKDYDCPELQPESVADQMKALDRLAANVMQSRETGRQPIKSSVILKRMYIPANEKYPDGHCWIWAHGKLLDDYDLQAGQYPLEREGWFPLPGRLYPLSLIELIMADQRQLNILLSQIGEQVNRDLRGDIITAGVNQQASEKIVNKRTGAKQIMLPPGCDKWEIMRYQPDLQAADTMYQWIMNDLHEKSGQNRPSLGQDVGREVRVTELQIAREADFQSLGWHMKQFARAHCKIGMQKLALTAEYVKNYRMIPGANEKEQVILFRGADLRDTQDVISIPVPHMSPAMKRQAQIQARQEGLTGPYPGIEAQLSARMQLKQQGLIELEEEVARTYGPFEELQEKAKEIIALKEQAEFASIEAQLAQLAMATQQMQAQATMPGQGGPEGIDPNAGGPIAVPAGAPN